VVDRKRHFRAAGRVTMEEARLLHAEWELQISAPHNPAKALRFNDIEEAYLAKLTAEGKGYVRCCTLFLTRMREFWGNILTSELTPELIKRFQSQLRAGGASPAYVDRHLAIGKAAWNYSLTDAPNPFKKVKLYNPDNTLIRFLTPDEETRLLEAAKKLGKRFPPFTYEMLLVAIHTGMRASNIFRLHTDEVDFDTRTIRVRQKRNLRLDVGMNSIVHDALKRIAPEEPGWFFPNPMTGEPYGDIGKTFAKVKKAAKITKPFRFHDLRHHFGYKMARESGNILLVRSALGHRDIKTSLKYVHTVSEDVRAALEKMAAPPKESPQKSPQDSEQHGT